MSGTIPPDPDELLELGREDQWRELLDSVQRAVPKIKGVAAGLRGQGQDEAARILEEAAGTIAAAAIACLDVTQRIDEASLRSPRR